MGKYTFHDAESHGDETLTATQILAQSSNIGTIEVAQGLGETRLAQPDLATSASGIRRASGSPASPRGWCRAVQWTGTSIGSTPIGQDDAVTAQQVLDAYNTVATGGVFVPPRLIRATVAPTGRCTPPPPRRPTGSSIRRPTPS